MRRHVQGSIGRCRGGQREAPVVPEGDGRLVAGGRGHRPGRDGRRRVDDCRLSVRQERNGGGGHWTGSGLHWDAIPIGANHGAAGVAAKRLSMPSGATPCARACPRTGLVVTAAKSQRRAILGDGRPTTSADGEAEAGPGALFFAVQAPYGPATTTMKLPTPAGQDSSSPTARTMASQQDLDSQASNTHSNEAAPSWDFRRHASTPSGRRAEQAWPCVLAEVQRRLDEGGASRWFLPLSAGTTSAPACATIAAMVGTGRREEPALSPPRHRRGPHPCTAAARRRTHYQPTSTEHFLTERGPCSRRASPPVEAGTRRYGPPSLLHGTHTPSPATSIIFGCCNRRPLPTYIHMYIHRRTPTRRRVHRCCIHPMYLLYGPHINTTIAGRQVPTVSRAACRLRYASLHRSTPPSPALPITATAHHHLVARPSPSSRQS